MVCRLRHESTTPAVGLPKGSAHVVEKSDSKAVSTSDKVFETAFAAGLDTSYPLSAHLVWWTLGVV